VTTLGVYGADDLPDRLPALEAAYLDVFSAPPWNERDAAGFLARLRDAGDRPGFRAVLATDERHPGDVEGFATGWITPDPLPTGRAYDRVRAAIGDPAVRDLLVGAFEVDELAVRPRARGTHLGGRLLAALVAPEPRAWLLTSSTAVDTVAFYRREGWRELRPAAGAGQGVTTFLSPGHPGRAPL
jgi:GNAT superfamily N-acetyltransferase